MMITRRDAFKCAAVFLAAVPGTDHLAPAAAAARPDVAPVPTTEPAPTPPSFSSVVLQLTFADPKASYTLRMDTGSDTVLFSVLAPHVDVERGELTRTLAADAVEQALAVLAAEIGEAVAIAP